jgi:acyl-CoA thioester hydrolase
MRPYTAEFTAAFADTDAAGIVHFSTVFRWVEGAEEGVFAELNLPFLSREGAVLRGFPRVRVECDYLSPVHRGDKVTLTLQPSEIGDKSITWAFVASVASKAVAKGILKTVYAWRDGEGPMQAALVPSSVKSALESRFQA